MATSKTFAIRRRTDCSILYW